MGGFDTEKKQTVWLRDNGRCWYCGEAVWVGDIHHRLARKMGGANARLEWINWAANLLTLHRRCHDEIEDSPDLARASGWMISAHQDPENVLVWSVWEGLWYRLHGPEFYKTPTTGILAPFPGADPPTWEALAA